MTIDEAKKRIKQLENYVKLLENYEPQSFEQEAMYLYVQLNNVAKVAELLNEKGYKIGNRKVISNDVSDVIRTKAADEIHELAKKSFNSNRRRVHFK